MNKETFNRTNQEVKRLLDINNAKEGDIRFGRNEGWKHYLAKCIVVRLLKEGTPPEGISSTMETTLNKLKTLEMIDIGLYFAKGINKAFIKLKKWELPFVYTEARFSKHLIADVLAVTIDGIFVFVLIDKEDEKSLKRKKRIYKNMGANKGLTFNFVEVRV